MPTVAVRVPEAWKGEMAQVDVSWGEVLRGAIRAKLDQVKRQRLLDDYLALGAGASPTPAGLAARSVREDRDAG
jgi:hypothetical protein